jgi:hypothetical protein
MYQFPKATLTDKRHVNRKINLVVWGIVLVVIVIFFGRRRHYILLSSLFPHPHLTGPVNWTLEMKTRKTKNFEPERTEFIARSIYWTTYYTTVVAFIAEICAKHSNQFYSTLLQLYITAI